MIKHETNMTKHEKTLQQIWKKSEKPRSKYDKIGKRPAANMKKRE